MKKIESSLLEQLKRASIAKQIQLEMLNKPKEEEKKPEPKRPKWA